jgi:hypothetical protein
MFAAMEEVEPGEETTHLGAVSHYLDRYLRVLYKPELPGESQHDRALLGKPAKIAGFCCFDMDFLLKFVQTEFNQRPDKSTVIQRLMRLGCRAEKKSLRKGQNVTSRNLWVVPEKFIEDRELLFNTEAQLLEDEREERLSVH